MAGSLAGLQALDIFSTYDLSSVGGGGYSARQSVSWYLQRLTGTGPGPGTSFRGVLIARLPGAGCFIES